VSATDGTACTGFAPATTIGDIDSAPILAGGKLYVGTNNGVVHCLDKGTGSECTGFPYSASSGTGPVKGFINVDTANGRLFYATTSKVWAIKTDGSALWNVALADTGTPSVPLLLPGADRLLVGSSLGKLYRFSNLGTNPPTQTPEILGDGLAVIGTPGFDSVNNLAYVGSDAGVVYAVVIP
jgi:outer membrane protein assembly factor BamB